VLATPAVAGVPGAVPDDVQGVVAPQQEVGESNESTEAASSRGLAWVLLLLAQGTWLAVSLGVIVHRRLWALPPLLLDEQSRQSTGLLLLTGGMLLWLASMLGVQSAAAIMELDAQADPMLRDQAWMLLGAYTGAAVALGVVALLVPRLLRHVGIGGRPSDIGAGLGWLLLAFPITAMLGMVASFVWEKLTGEPADLLGHETLRKLMDPEADGWRWVVIALVTIGPAVYEEIVYRGMLQGGLRHLLGSRWGAILGTSALFSVMHIGAVDWRALLPLFVLSVVLGVVYERRGRLAASIVLHFAFNLTNIVVAGVLTGVTRPPAACTWALGGQPREPASAAGRVRVLLPDREHARVHDAGRQARRDPRSTIEIVKDWLACGIDPDRSTFVLQTEVPAIAELTWFLAMLLPFNRVMRNPTLKTEIEDKGLGDTYSFGFPMYAVGQCADILAFRPELVPVGEDQVAHIEPCREVARRFNQLYCGVDPQTMTQTTCPRGRAVPDPEG
jgi:membrane protease YdiL (CAAX protease family)